MTDTADSVATPVADRAPGYVLIACAIASVVLLANHPGGDARTLMGVLQGEAASQNANAVVHGGFIGLQVVELAALAMLAMRLGAGRMWPVIALTFAAAGAAALSGSLLIDGLVVPAIAAKYLAQQPLPDIATVKPLISLCNLLIRFLMPLGLAFQAAANLCWAASLWRVGGAARIVGFAAAALGATVLAALLATLSTLNPLIVMGGIGGQALLVAAIGALLALRRL